MVAVVRHGLPARGVILRDRAVLARDLVQSLHLREERMAADRAHRLGRKVAAVRHHAGEVVGDVRSVAMSPRHGGVAIAMVRREVATGATLHARWAGGECTVQIAA